MSTNAPSAPGHRNGPPNWLHRALLTWAILGTATSVWLWFGAHPGAGRGSESPSGRGGVGVVARFGMKGDGSPVFGLTLQLYPERPGFPERVRGAASAAAPPVFELPGGRGDVLLATPAEWAALPPGQAVQLKVTSSSDSVLVALATTTTELARIRDLSLQQREATLAPGRYALVLETGRATRTAYPFELKAGGTPATR